LKAIEAGVDIIDVALSPFALRTSEPPVEPFVVALYGTDRDTGLDIEQLFKCGQMLEQVAPKYRDFLDTSAMSIIDAGVLVHQIPGGMTTNLVAQLKEVNALDRLDEVRAEVAKTRAELGYPPLVTPTSQIVGVQAVQNVLVGRYEMITQETKDYCYGLYGRPPAPIDKEILKIVLKDYKRGKKPIVCRPADVMEPGLEKAGKESKEFARNIQDVLTYALFPTTGSRFLKYKYGIDKTIPDDWKPPRAPKTLEEVKKEDELISKAKAGEVVAKPEKVVPKRGPGLRTFNVFIEDEYYKVEVEALGESPVNPFPRPVSTVAPSPASPSPTEAPAKAEEKKAPPADVVEGTEVPAPMPGMVIRYLVNVGDKVKAGDPLLILEAMKMQNNIPTPVDGVVRVINFEPGASVNTNDILAVIG
jgi:pyruvate carboxylase subunit B